jgi:hypothetical protein
MEAQPPPVLVDINNPLLGDNIQRTTILWEEFLRIYFEGGEDAAETQ